MAWEDSGEEGERRGGGMEGGGGGGARQTRHGLLWVNTQHPSKQVSKCFDVALF